MLMRGRRRDIGETDCKHRHKRLDEKSMAGHEPASPTGADDEVMPKLIVTDRSGNEAEFEGQEGFSVMEIIREGGVDELLALCGGCCSCATCHVYVDDAFSAALPPMSDDENDLLECSDHRSAASRLSCQIRFSAALGGLRVTVAPED
jgi:2Fe-2S ferredoxin